MARVVSCRYMRISCSEDDHPLFRRYYARSNRERGVKITTRRSRLTAGATDTRKATQSVWIRADRGGESKQTYKNGVLFVLNNHRFPKWLYSYDSSVTRTKREMTHHLVVYICQLTGTRSQPRDIDVAVLARHESPGFSLISYRRSGNNGSDAGCDLPAIDVASSTKFTAVDFDSPGFPKDDRHEMRLVDAMQLISEFGCLDFTVEDDASGLSVRSAVSMSASACITLVLDGKLRVFRVLPSGISSMIATTGGWSIGDYTAAFAEDGRSLEVNLFSFAESTSNGFTIGDAQPINLRRSASDGIVKLRRVSLLIRLEQEFNIEVTGSTVQRDLFAFAHGTVHRSTLSIPINECRNGFKLSERSAVDRAATWSEVEWAALWEWKAVYITLSRAFS
ncbi:hypothetical protein PC123_g20274 [Phytophthora cactorum]|nr:hypothetical protein PC123_g20274 [Phytophthora cactorum]